MFRWLRKKNIVAYDRADNEAEAILQRVRMFKHFYRGEENPSFLLSTHETEILKKHPRGWVALQYHISGNPVGAFGIYNDVYLVEDRKFPTTPSSVFLKAVDVDHAKELRFKMPKRLTKELKPETVQYVERKMTMYKGPRKVAEWTHKRYDNGYEEDVDTVYFDEEGKQCEAPE